MTFSNRLFKPLFLVISLVFKTLVLLRIHAYNKGWLKTNHIKTPVISVGNLTVGGTGKTPVVDFLVKEFQRFDKKPAILSRGYKRKDSAIQQRLRICEDKPIDPAFFGDEPYLLALRNPQVPVYVGNSRTITAHSAEEKDQPHVLILDDAYQHLAIHRDLNLLLIDAQHGFGNRHLLPYGVLREPESQWKRADAIILTKTNLATSNSVLQMLTHELKVSCPIFSFNYEIQNLVRLDGKANLKLAELKNKRILLTSGIAQPKGFEKLLEQQEVEISGKIEFPDHHDYHEDDVQKILNQQKKMQPEYILTTEKDAVKLSSFPELLEHVWVLEMETRPEDSWYDFFAEFLHAKFEII